MKTAYAPLEVSSYLDSDEVVAEYLTAAAEDENRDVLLTALAEVAKARGMTQVAEAAGLGRESLYKALAPGAQPRFHTIRAVLRALNVDVRIAAKAAPIKGGDRSKAQSALLISESHEAAKERRLALLAAKRRKLRKEAAKRPAPKRRA